MFRNLLFLSIISMMFACASAQNSPRTNKLRKITRQIISHDTKIDFTKIPGIIAGMIDKDSSYVIDYGTAEKNSDNKLTEHTIFELGSASKVFTVTLLAIMVEDGMLDYYNKVNDLLPDSIRNPNADSLLIKHLLMHTSSLPKLPNDIGLKQVDPTDPYASYTKDDVLAYYSSYPFKDWEEKYNYSHYGFALLEVILEMVGKDTYANLLSQKVLLPFGMNETYLGLNENLYKNAAQGYSESGRKTTFWTFASFEGSMGVRSSLHDLMILMRTYLGIENGNNNEIFESCFKERIDTEFAPNIEAAYGWHAYNHKGKYYDVYLHSGKSSGHQVTMHFVPETQTSVIVLSNSRTSLNSLGYLMLALVNNQWKLSRKQKRVIKKGLLK